MPLPLVCLALLLVPPLPLLKPKTILNTNSTSLLPFSPLPSRSSFFLISFLYSLFSWHGTLMIVAFGFCLSLGIFLPRYLKSFWWWFPLHIALQIFGVFLSIIAFILALIFATGNHFSTIHA